jgi:hypothetical protein
MTTSCGGAGPAGVEPPDPARAQHVVTYHDVSIEVVAEGAGRPLLPAGTARSYPDSLSALVTTAADPSRADPERLRALQAAFFAPGNDPTEWL